MKRDAWVSQGPGGDLSRWCPLRRHGNGYQYSNPGFAMLSYVVTARKGNIRTLLRDRIMRPIGVPDSEWSIGYGETVYVSNLPLVASWGGGNYSPRALACVARLMLRTGDWNGSHLISASAVSQVTGDVGTPPRE
jgi:CubicO group peptidase (beta-lactamase class C family)